MVCIPEGQRCGAQTNLGHYCRRKAKTTFRQEWEESFLFFFKRKKVYFYYYCTQHAAKSLVGVQVI